MLDIAYIRDHPDEVKKGAAAKGVDLDMDEILRADDRRREAVSAFEEKRAAQNASGEAIARETDPEAKKKAIEEMRALKEEIAGLEEARDIAEHELDKLLRLIPNLPKPDVKTGADESDNEVLREEGERPSFEFSPKDFVELGESLDIVDTERAAKTSGARFGYLKGDGALLEFALMQYARDHLVARGFTPLVPPVLVKPEVMAAMGYMDRHADEVYALRDDELVLIGTSEQAVGPMHMNETLDPEKLPLRYAAFSTCFRREAGSYGKDTRGIFRVHQFDKLEMFSLTAADASDREHKFMLELQEELMRGLRLPYRVVRLCSGDLGTPAARTYDIETWFPSQERYRETHSASTTTDFQSRRLHIRYKDPETGKPAFVHMLNGTAFSSNRPILAILENYQQADGTVKVPDVLVPYMGKAVIE